MNKKNVGTRILALILALAMILPMIPSATVKVSAAGSIPIATGEKVGDTGLSGNIDKTSTISWPIRIYDYLNDGMLFEYANGGGTGDISDSVGGAYGGGTPAPQFTGAESVIGNDYTISGTYNEYAYYYWIGQRSPYEYSVAQGQAVNFQNPRYLHLQLDNNYSDAAPAILSDFLTDNYTSYSKDRVRYITLVYRTGDLTDTEAVVNVAWQTNLTGNYAPYSDVSCDYGVDWKLTKNTTGWNYLVIDMCRGTLSTANKWNSVTEVKKVLFDFHFTTKGDYIDISHIAYFSTAFEAEQFGMDAVAFDNDPGEYLDAHMESSNGGTVNNIARPSFTYGADYTNAASFNDASYTSMGTYPFYMTTSQQTYTNSNGGSVSYMNVTEGYSGRDYSWVTNLSGDGFTAYPSLSDVRYCVIVYRTHGMDSTNNNKIAFWIEESDGDAWAKGTGSWSNYWADQAFTPSSTWRYAVFDLRETDIFDYNDGYDYNELNVSASSITSVDKIGIYFPGFASDESMDISHLCFFSSESAASSFGQQALNYVNNYSDGTTTAQKSWNQGNNVAFSLLYANQGGGWVADNVNGGDNALPNGYFNYQIGYKPWEGAAEDTNADRTTAKNRGYPVADDIFFLSSYSQTDKETDGSINMHKYDLGGYRLYNNLYEGVMTAGLLEARLTTVTVDGITYRVPEYKADTIGYIAHLLKSSLCIGKTDPNGNYNYNFVAGTANGAQYGYDASGNPLDLASALRLQLGITLPANGNFDETKLTNIGSYADTIAHRDELIGPYADCKAHIHTFYDAAYYLLMNLYIADSYNQSQNEYNYLVLSAATLSDGKEAYVFDGGFTTGIKANTADTDAYRDSSLSAVVFDRTNGTISLSSATSKDKVVYNNSETTTRFPFLPVTHSEGVYAGETKSPYFLDDGEGVMGVTEEGATFVNRNYNYAIASNGEFVYYAEDELYFDFEGDDDVYLFINGELVVDVGAAHSITVVSTKVDDYVKWAQGVVATLPGYESNMTDAQVKALVSSKTGLAYDENTYLRAHHLNLEDGQICDFDFYYMERHGWGANCRIASNINVTEPGLRVDKTANQGGMDVAYGDVVVASDAIEYNFKLTNNGNTKLFNLTFADSTIGVTLDYTNGLTVASGFNGMYLFDANGGKLEASDLTAVVTGWMPVDSGGTHSKQLDGTYAEDPNGTHVYTEITTTFASNQDLINFLSHLAGKGLDGEEVNSSRPQGGYGLWVDADVTIKGMYYRMSGEQRNAGVLNNTVYVTATTQPNPSDPASVLLKSQDNHRVYVSGAPAYYQWAGHNLYLPMADIIADAQAAAASTGSQLSEYKKFLDNLPANYSYALSDKRGNVIGDTNEVKKHSGGYLVNYPTPGTNSFYILASNSAGTSAENMAEGTYAIIRVTIFVTKVEDSYYVLDYGLATEDLGTNGELFKNDELFGASGANEAKMMGVSTEKPSYLDYTSNTTNYNRISFTPVTNNASIPFADGHYSLNIANGKNISFNSFTGNYSLNEVGTVKVNVNTPDDWDTVYLYYWYDGGANSGWPGTPMTRDSIGHFVTDIPGDITHVIVSNGTMQSGNLMLTPGQVNTITVSSPADETSPYLDALVSSMVPVTVTVRDVPANWSNVHLYCFVSGTNQNNGGWPGVPMNKNADGSYSLSVLGSYDRMIVNNGVTAAHGGEQTADLAVTAGTNITISNFTNKTTYNRNNANPEEGSYTTYDATADSQLMVDYYPIRVSVPSGWGDVYLHAWNANGGSTVWPGIKMTPDSDGLYALDIPADTAYIIVNNNQGKQTVDVKIIPGVEATVKVTNAGSDGKYLATVNYNNDFTFTPSAFMDDTYSIYMAITVHNAEGNPTDLNKPIDPSEEVQMYKQITVLPANVVYYEDDFPAIQYENTAGTGKVANTITVIGSSDDLSQSVDQDQEYGQDSSYETNSDMSGNSLHIIDIKNSNVTATFQFTGTGFELIGRTNADDSASITVEVWSGNTIIKRIPVVTKFDNNEGGNTPGGDEEIYQVPVIRITDLPHGAYTVKIKGVCGCVCTEKCGTTKNEDCILCKYAPGSCDPTVKHLYLDGIRVFQPLGAANEHYNNAENGASFSEIRDMIVDGTAAVAKYDGNALSVSSGTITWTENLGVETDNITEFTGNQVASADDYLLRGPNNEVYMNGTVANAALVFTVKCPANDTSSPSMQLAIRAIDEAKFYVGSTAAPTETVSGMSASIEFYAKQSDGSFAWEPLVTITSATEQYYAIDLNRCYSENGNILVAVRVSSGMASFTSVKINHLEMVKTAGATASTLYYIGGQLAVCVCDNVCTNEDDAAAVGCVLCKSDFEKCSASTQAGEIEEIDGGISLAYLSRMMSSPSVSENLGSESVPGTQPDADPDAQPDVEPDAEPDVEPDAEPDVEPDTEPDTKLDAGSQPEYDSGTKPEPEPDVQPDTDADSQPDDKAEPDAKPETSKPAPAPSPSAKPDKTPDTVPVMDVSARNRLNALWNTTKNAFGFFRRIFS